MIYLLLVISYIVCGILAYGISFAHFQRKYLSLAEEHYYKDMTICIVIGMCGWSGLLVVLLASDKLYGFKWR